MIRLAWYSGLKKVVSAPVRAVSSAARFVNSNKKAIGAGIGGFMVGGPVGAIGAGLAASNRGGGTASVLHPDDGPPVSNFRKLMGGYLNQADGVLDEYLGEDSSGTYETPGARPVFAPGTAGNPPWLLFVVGAVVLYLLLK